MRKRQQGGGKESWGKGTGGGVVGDGLPKVPFEPQTLKETGR